MFFHVAKTGSVTVKLLFFLSSLKCSATRLLGHLQGVFIKTNHLGTNSSLFGIVRWFPRIYCSNIKSRRFQIMCTVLRVVSCLSVSVNLSVGGLLFWEFVCPCVYLDNGGGGWSFKDLSLLEGLCGASSLLFSLSDSPDGWYIGLCGIRHEKRIVLRKIIITLYTWKKDQSWNKQMLTDLSSFCKSIIAPLQLSQ